VSHTTKIKVEFKDKDSLSRAVEAIGGKILGEGNHRLYGGSYEGFGFVLPGWQYPCILGADGALSYDNYGGAWGKADVLDLLKGEYALQVAESVSLAQGWISERCGDAVIIHHPDGGTITVTSAGVDASQFMGANCVSACSPLELALGSAPERMLKTEYFNRPQEIIIKEGGE
jgi:hypothetical protein